MDLINSCALEIVGEALAIQRIALDDSSITLVPDFPITQTYMYAEFSRDRKKRDGAQIILTMDKLVRDMPLEFMCERHVRIVLSELVKQVFPVLGLGLDW